MTTDADGLRRLADVVDTLRGTGIEPDGAQLLEVDEEQIRGQVTVTVPVDGDLEIGDDSPQEDEPKAADNEVDEDTDDASDDLLDHTSTEDLQLAYDEADGNISAAADRFEVGYAAVYRRMVQHDVHETESDEDDSEENGTSTEGDTPTSNVDSESEAEEDVVLEEEAADDDAGDAGVDVQEEDEDLVLVPVNKRSAAKVYHLRDPDNPDQPKCGAAAKQWKPTPTSTIPGRRLCENCENGGRRGGPGERDGYDDAQTDPDPITVDAVDDPDDIDTKVELPDGVTVDDVEEAVNEHETLGDVGEAIGVTRGRARSITVGLGCYGDVKDLPAGGR